MNTVQKSSYFNRNIHKVIDVALSDTPVVSILGARQTGKSTLCKYQWNERTHITLNDLNLLKSAKKAPKRFISELPDYVTIDEVQRVPELMLVIKHTVDNDCRPGRFLLKGSANLLQLPQLADSLAGRIECLYMHPFTEAE